MFAHEPDGNEPLEGVEHTFWKACPTQASADVGHTLGRVSAVPEPQPPASGAYEAAARAFRDTLERVLAGREPLSDDEQVRIARRAAELAAAALQAASDAPRAVVRGPVEFHEDLLAEPVAPAAWEGRGDLS